MSNISSTLTPGSSFYMGYHSLVNGFHGHIGYGDEIKPSFPSLTSKEPPTWKKVLTLAKETFETIAKEFWKYFKLTSKVLKNILKVVKVAFTETEEKISTAIAYLGLANIIKVFFNGKSFYESTLELENCIKISDIEGAIFATLDILKQPFDVASNLLSFGKSLDKIVGLAWMSLFSAVTFPLSLALLCFDTVRRIYNTIMIAIEFAEMPNWDSPDASKKFKDYLQEKVGITEKERDQIKEEIQDEFDLVIKNSKYCRNPTPLSGDKSRNAPGADDAIKEKVEKELALRVQVLKDRKINILKRHTDKKIVDYMLKAKAFIEENPGKDHKAEASLEDLKKLTVRKLVINCGESFFNIADLVMTVVAMIFPLMHAAIPITLSLASTCFSVGKQFYQEYGMTAGLANQEFLRA